MKIYQLHEYGGQWEDSFDYIIDSYLKKERAVLNLRLREVTKVCQMNIKIG